MYISSLNNEETGRYEGPIIENLNTENSNAMVSAVLNTMAKNKVSIKKIIAFSEALKKQKTLTLEELTNLQMKFF